MLPQVISMEKKYCEGLTGAGDGMLLDMMPWLRHFGIRSYKILTEAVRIRKMLWAKYLPAIKVVEAEQLYITFREPSQICGE